MGNGPVLYPSSALTGEGTTKLLSLCTAGPNYRDATLKKINSAAQEEDIADRTLFEEEDAALLGEGTLFYSVLKCTQMKYILAHCSSSNYEIIAMPSGKKSGISIESHIF